MKGSYLNTVDHVFVGTFSAGNLSWLGKIRLINGFSCNDPLCRRHRKHMQETMKPSPTMEIHCSRGSLLIRDLIYNLKKQQTWWLPMVTHGYPKTSFLHLTVDLPSIGFPDPNLIQRLASRRNNFAQEPEDKWEPIARWSPSNCSTPAKWEEFFLSPTLWKAEKLEELTNKKIRTSYMGLSTSSSWNIEL